MGILVNIILNGIIVYAASYILPGVHLQSFLTALIVAIILGVVNTFIKPLITVLTFPLTLFTFGLFMFVINGILILLVAKIVPGFIVDNLWWAILLSIAISLIGTALHAFTKRSA